jgi:hypothetical protein
MGDKAKPSWRPLGGFAVFKYGRHCLRRLTNGSTADPACWLHRPRSFAPGGLHPALQLRRIEIGQHLQDLGMSMKDLLVIAGIAFGAAQ